MMLRRDVVDRMRGTAIVPAGLAAALIFFSMVVGWNVLTVVFYFFLVAPALAIYLPRMVSGNKGHMFKSTTGLIIFYAFMVFMIYDHYKSDYFQVMMVGFVINIIAVPLIIRLKTSLARTRSLNP